MDAIVGAFNSATGLKGKKDDDFIDRLSSRYTVVVLLVFAAIITFYQFGGSPIICWCPPHFTGAHMKYTYSYCWVHNTYYFPIEEEIPKVHETDRKEYLLYYQWVPFILLTQALLFYFPSIIWHAFNQKAGVDSDNILACANLLEKTEKAEAREGMLMLLTNQIHRFLGAKKHQKTLVGSRWKKIMTSCLHCCGSRFSSYLTTLYIFSKFLYLGNILFQLHILNKFLSMRYNMYGFQVMQGLWSDHDWRQSHDVAFPRVTFCDLEVRRLGNVHRYSMQCALPLNLFNEKVYIFLWFWIILVLIATILGLVTWIIRVCMRKDRLRFIQNHLLTEGRLEDEKDLEFTHEFLDDYLGQDGTFVLRLISSNTNNITTSDIIRELWDNWLLKCKGRDQTTPLKDDDHSADEK